MRTLAVRMLGSSIEPMLLIRPVSTLSGYAFRRTSAVSPTFTLARLFSYTSQRTQTEERSAMVNGLGELSRDFTPADAVTFCSTITPDVGARTSTVPAG